MAVLCLSSGAWAGEKARVIVTSDGEVDDECSMVRFLLYANEWDIEAIVTSSSQYHWQGHRWAGDDWIDPYLEAYAEVYPSLLKHDGNYPSPEYLNDRTRLGNVKSEGDMEEDTPGSDLIVEVLLDESDPRPIWLQAWGGPNTIARALKKIEDDYPERMAEVANKLRFYFIWEQDRTYQTYILPQWGKYEIPTIISDQFWAMAYQWNKVQPEAMQTYLRADWMKENVLENHGPLCSLYKAHEEGSHGLSGDYDFQAGDFRSEGDSPAFLHTIPTGLRSLESPDWGGWGGRFVRVRDNTWLDPVPSPHYKYPEGRWFTGSAWGRVSLRQGETTFNNPRVKEYFRPMWRWTEAVQNDFAARADWTVMSYEDSNHPPDVKLAHAQDLKVVSGQKVILDATGTTDPDDDSLKYRWWQFEEADTYAGIVSIEAADEQRASFTVPDDAAQGETIHLVVEVTDSGAPPLTRYRRVVARVAASD